MRDSGAVETLRKARKLIERSENWTQGSLFRRKQLSWIKRFFGVQEFAYCASGALHEVIKKGTPTMAHHFLDEGARLAGFRSFVTLNDATNHATVLRMFDDAIALAEGE